MKISMNWLFDYLDLDEFLSCPEKLANKLILSGLEVEDIVNQKNIFQSIVIGRIDKKIKHPNADKLTLCKVNIGNEQLSIVCGAKNHKEGDFVVVARVGASLPCGLNIKKSKLRGEDSEGMLCSEAELGLEPENDGIIILKEDPQKPFKLGQLWADYKGFDDVLFHINITPNRADCLSHWGLARELSSLLNKKLKPLPESQKNLSSFISKTVNKQSIVLKDKESCTRYACRIIKGVKIQESPNWLKKRLESVGLNSINNVVDITNFIMMDRGQPLHAFDLKHINGSIIIRSSSKGEKLKTLDKREILLTDEELLITDEKNILALAGVIGGLGSSVTEGTVDLLIESAHFHSMAVRRTARRFGFQTDSADRFSKGVDVEGVMSALDRACEMIIDIAGGAVSDVTDERADTPIRRPIKIEKFFLEDRLGYAVNMKHFEELMCGLQCVVKHIDDVSCEVTPPSFRYDIDQAVDLVEEYAKLVGYDAIPETLPPLVGEPSPDDLDYKRNQLIIEKFKEMCFLQAVNYHFVSDEFQDFFLGDSHKRKDFSTFVEGENIFVKNPLNPETNIMRKSLLSGLVQNLIYNFRHDQHYGALFELGSVFGTGLDKNNKSHDPIKGPIKNLQKKYYEQTHVGLVAWGAPLGLWSKKVPPLVIDVKSKVERVLKSLKLNFKWRSLDMNKTPEFLHPKKTLELVVRGKSVGFIGGMHPQMLKHHKLKDEVVVGEFNVKDWNMNWSFYNNIKTSYKYPSVFRDVSILTHKKNHIADFEKIFLKTIPQLVSCQVLDIYEGGSLPEEYHSILFRLIYQDSEKTLTEEQVSRWHKQILDRAKNQLGIEIR